MQKFVSYILLFFVVLVQLSCTDSRTKQLKRPNIVMILTDDHAKKAMSIYDRSLMETPNLDRIGNEGITFDRAFVTNSICAPSRAVILTGKYSHINGLRNNQDRFNASQPTFITHLKQAGYQTFLVGKWHLKEPPEGFDYYNILVDQGTYYSPIMIENGDTARQLGYSTTRITDLSIDALQKRDTSKPFCLLFWHKAPHRNWMPDTKHLGAFQNKDIPIPVNFFDDYKSRTSAVREADMEIKDMYLSMDMKLWPQYYGEETGTGGLAKHNPESNWERTYNLMDSSQKIAWDAYYNPINQAYRENRLSGEALAKWKYRRYMEDYLSTMLSVDENVGRMLDYLDMEGLTNETMIIYSSDQGFYLGEHGWYDKRFMYEESFSTPLCIRYPGLIPAGIRSQELVLNLDFAPTILDLAQTSVPNDMQGESMRPLLETGTQVEWRDDVYYHYYQSGGWHSVKKHYGVRTERYKLIHFYEAAEWEMYDLEQDPNEMNNLYNVQSYQSVQLDLEERLKKLREKYQVTD